MSWSGHGSIPDALPTKFFRFATCGLARHLCVAADLSLPRTADLLSAAKPYQADVILGCFFFAAAVLSARSCHISEFLCELPSNFTSVPKWETDLLL